VSFSEDLAKFVSQYHAFIDIRQLPLFMNIIIPYKQLSYSQRLIGNPKDHHIPVILSTFRCVTGFDCIQGLRIRLNFRFGSNKDNFGTCTGRREIHRHQLSNFSRSDRHHIHTMSVSVPYISQWEMMQMMAQERGIPVRRLSLCCGRVQITFHRVCTTCARRGFMPSLLDLLSSAIEDDSPVEEAEMLTCVV
jgi:hypothetical protein